VIIFQGIFPLLENGPAPLAVTSLTVGVNTLVLTFNLPVGLTGASLIAANWTITGGVTPPPTVISVSVTAVNEITLVIPEDEAGESRTLNVPNGIIKLSDSSALPPPYIFNYTSSAIAPFITTIVNLESQIPLLSIASISQIQDNRYRLQLSDYQTPGVGYTLTASNIHDVAGNPV